VSFNSVLYISNDYGATWSKSSSNVLSNKTFTSLSVSYSGQYQTICSPGSLVAFIYYSKDYGVMWNLSDIQPQNWVGVACSTTGKYQIALVESFTINSGNPLYYSTNYGETWNQNTDCSLNLPFTSCAISSNGQYQTIVYGYENTSVFVSVQEYISGIYYSANSGKTWTQANASPSGNNFNLYNFVAMSGDGKYQTVVSGIKDGYIYYSSDYGANWTKSDAPLAIWNAVSIDSTGKYQVVSSEGSVNHNNDGFYYSSNYGVNWIKCVAGLSNTQYPQSYGASISASGVNITVSSGSQFYTQKLLQVYTS
jgi:hypothetical protein